MSERRDEFAPRVIVTERDAVAGETIGVAPRVIASERTDRIVPVVPPPRPVAARARPRRGGRLLALGLTAIVAGLAGVTVLATLDWLVDLAVRSPTLGVLASGFVALAVAGAGAIAWHELASLARLKSVETVQRRFRDAVPASEARDAVAALLAVLPHDHAGRAGISAFQARVRAHHSAGEQVEILVQTVIRPLDHRAEAAIRKASLRAFGITALSPTALTDAVFFLAVSVRMMREVAQAYGLRPTAATTVHLVRRLVREAGTLGAIDLATAGLMQHLGAGAAERVSSAAAESLYAGQRMARLGLAVMQMCRPLAFVPGEQPSLTSLVGGLFRRSTAALEPGLEATQPPLADERGR